jgi:hypothetical protein
MLSYCPATCGAMFVDIIQSILVVTLGSVRPKMLEKNQGEGIVHLTNIWCCQDNWELGKIVRSNHDVSDLQVRKPEL